MKFKQIDFAKQYTIYENGDIFGPKLSTPMKCSMMDCGYFRIKIICDDGVKRAFLLHRLLALSFIPNPDNKPQINHINGIKTDNRLCNLEWCTSRENQLHAYQTGLKRIPAGEVNGRNILKEEDVIKIYYRLLEGARIVDISREFSVARSTITSIKSKQNWGHILDSLPDIPHKKKSEKLSERTVIWVCEQLQQGVGPSEILRKSSNPNLKMDAILDIKRRRGFKHISKNYSW